METLVNLWNNESVKRIVISVGVVILVIVVWIAVRKITRAINGRRGEEARKDASTIKLVIYDTIKVLIFFLLILVILQINGVNVTSLVAGLGVASAIVGLALQDFMKDIIMGVHILLDNFFQIGDLVQYMDEEGIVEEFNLRTTKIRSLADGDLVIICNRDINKLARTSPEIYVRVPLPYELPVGQAHEIMEEIAGAIEKEEEITVCSFLGTAELGAHSVAYLLKVVIEEPAAKLRTRRRALRVVQEVLLEKKIEIPYEQLDVHLTNGK